MRAIILHEINGHGGIFTTILVYEAQILRETTQYWISEMTCLRLR